MSEELNALIAAVEAGDEDAASDLCRSISRDANDVGKVWPGYDAIKAYRGSLDAAKRLHDALLPGWSWWLGHDKPNIGESESIFAHVRNEELQDGMWVKIKHEAVSTCVSRAWLLAILRAVKAKG